MSKYTEEFKRNAIELMKQAGITKACKEMKLAHCTIYRWRRELERISANESDDSGSKDMNTFFEYQTSKEQPQPEPDVQVPDEAEEGLSENNDTIRHGTKFLFEGSSSPTFDLEDRLWSGVSKTVAYRDGGGVHLIHCMHGYQIPRIFIFLELEKSIPSFDEWMKQLDEG